MRRWAARTGLGLAAAGAVAAAGYAAYARLAWLRYGHPARPVREEADTLLDRFIPQYEVVERHHARVTAPAEVTLASAMEMDLEQSAIVHAIFKARELVLGAEQAPAPGQRGLVALTKNLGWGVLAEIPGREIVMGAVTQPWKANVVFRAVPAEQFAAFNEPDYVKIVWTLRADPLGPKESVFRSETRVITTDAAARAKFRRYWSRFSAGIALIRRISLGLVKNEAERRARAYRAIGSTMETTVPPPSGTSI